MFLMVTLDFSFSVEERNVENFQQLVLVSHVTSRSLQAGFRTAQAQAQAQLPHTSLFLYYILQSAQFHYFYHSQKKIRFVYFDLMCGTMNIHTPSLFSKYDCLTSKHYIANFTQLLYKLSSTLSRPHLRANPGNGSCQREVLAEYTNNNNSVGPLSCFVQRWVRLSSRSQQSTSVEYLGFRSWCPLDRFL